MRYSLHSTYKRFSALNIDNIGISDELDITRFGPDNRGSSIIFYVLDGKGYFNDNLVCKGQGFVHISNAFEEYHADPEQPWTLMWVATDDSAMKTMFKHLNADKETCIFNCDLTDALPYLMEKFTKLHKFRVNRAEMLEIFMSILKFSSDVPTFYKRNNNERDYIDYATNYIQTYYHTKITVADLTKALGISQPYLFRLFQNHFNKSPKQYITDFRIEQAKRLLDETDMSIYQISNAVGYPDSFAFSKIFSKKYGRSPRSFRTRLNSPHSLR